jgi:transcriptional regulator with XRE-family HTH domain
MKRRQEFHDKRRDLGVGRHDLARQIGVHSSTLTRWELGYTTPSRSNISRWGRTLAKVERRVRAGNYAPTEPIGPRHCVRVNLMLNKRDLDEFWNYIPRGERSKYIRSMIRQFIKARKESESPCDVRSTLTPNQRAS